jgi:hypothetical protein
MCVFLWAKGLNAKDIYKEMFRAYGGKCLSCKSVLNWVEKFFEGCSKIADDARPGAEVAETTVKSLPCCYGTSVSVLVEDMARNKCFIPGFEFHMFYVLYPFVTYLLTLPRILTTMTVLVANFYHLAIEFGLHLVDGFH